jgi:3',5'-cyclic AMP phosphodiesterase CpdA
MNAPSIRPCREAARHSAATPPPFICRAAAPFICGGAAPFIRRAAALFIAAAALATASATAAPPPRFDFDADGSFAFFQVSDIQDQGKLSERSAAVLRAALAAAKPRLVILTGDNVNTASNRRDAFAGAMEPVVKIFEEFRTPFCVTFGNHDSERKGDDFLTRQEQYDWLKQRGGKLFVDHDVPELTGVGSGMIELFVPGAKKPSVRLFPMDSGDYSSGGYDGCHADQIAWYERVAADGVPHLWFQHIIVPDANDTGLFRAEKEGEKGIEMRVRGEKVQAVPADGVLGALKEHTCPPGWGAYRDKEHTVDGRTLYEAWRANGHMVGAYFGHDHMNTFDGVDENGIRLGATKALTVHSYNDGDPGLRLFVVHPDGSFETEHATEKKPFPVPADGKPYRPAAPQPLPIAVPAEPVAPDPFPPLASFALPKIDKGGLYRPGLLEELRGFRRVVPGPVQALANKNGVTDFAETAQAAKHARPWESGDLYRYRGQVFAASNAVWRFGEKMWDFTIVKLDGKNVFGSSVYETADCSDAIPVKAGWHEIEIVFENEKGRAGAAWPEYVDKGVPTGPGFGIAKDASKASTDPADYTFPADIGDGSLFRVPVEGAPIRVTGIRENQGVEVDIEYDELPAEAEITGIFQVGGDKLFSPSAVETPVGTIPAGKKGNQTISFANKLKVNSFRLRATMPGANLVWWSDVLRP